MEEIVADSPELAGPIDPLLEALSFFASTEDLNRRIDEVAFLALNPKP